jgi:Pyruvate ferredoxin/flavodoxin oxidoreductase
VDVLVALTQEACQRFVRDVEPGGLLIVDAGQVRIDERLPVTCRALPISETAVRLLGTPVGANLVALGALVEMSGAVPVKAMSAPSPPASRGAAPSGGCARFAPALSWRERAALPLCAEP